MDEETVENENPSVVKDIFHLGCYFLRQYGWHLVILVLLLAILYKKYFEHFFHRFSKPSSESLNKKYDLDEVLQRQEAMEASRRRLQETHDAKAAAFKEKQKQKDEDKRQERIDDWDRHQQGKGYRSKFKPVESEDSANTSVNKQTSKKVTYRSSDFNPLMGNSGGGGYRPARRGGGTGGG